MLYNATDDRNCKDVKKSEKNLSYLFCCFFADESQDKHHGMAGMTDVICKILEKNIPADKVNVNNYFS